MITLHVEAETMNELILKATDALYGHTPQDAEQLYMALTKPSAPPSTHLMQTEIATVKATERPVFATNPTVEETPAPAKETATAAKPAPTAPAQKTLPEMREIVGRAVQKPGGREALATFLKEHGVKKLPELGAEYYSDLLSAMAPFEPEAAA